MGSDTSFNASAGIFIILITFGVAITILMSSTINNSSTTMESYASTMWEYENEGYDFVLDGIPVGGMSDELIDSTYSGYRYAVDSVGKKILFTSISRDTRVVRIMPMIR